MDSSCEAAGSFSEAIKETKEVILPEIEASRAEVVTKHAEVVSKHSLTQLRAWEAEAARRTAESYAMQDVNASVVVTLSNGDGTFTEAAIPAYSAKHWAELMPQAGGYSGMPSVESVSGLAAINTAETTSVQVKGWDYAGDGKGGLFFFNAARVLENNGEDVYFGWELYDRSFKEDGRGPSREPVYTVGWGQSNQNGAAEVPVGFLGTSNEIEDGVFIWSSDTLAWEVPVWGQSPLNSTGSNNASIRMANEIVKRTGRPVYIILSAMGGTSISAWVDNGTDSEMWSVNDRSVLKQINDSGMPRIDLVTGLHGEADSHDTVTGYQTKSLYTAGLKTLITQFKGLPQWREHTKFIMGGIGEWHDHTGAARNDVLLTLNQWSDRNVGNISTHGSARNPNDGQSSHFDHASLTLIGQRFAAKFLGENTDSASEFAGIYDDKGLARLAPQQTLSSGNTYDIDPQYLKGGAFFNANNATINLSDPNRYLGAIIVINVTSVLDGPTVLNAFLRDAVGTLRVDAVNYTSLELRHAGVWEFVSMNGYLYLKSMPETHNTYGAYSVSNEARILSTFDVKCGGWRLDTATITLPSPLACVGARVPFISYANSESTINSPEIYDKNGVVVSSLSLASAGNIVVLEAMNTRWAVVFSNM